MTLLRLLNPVVIRHFANVLRNSLIFHFHINGIQKTSFHKFQCTLIFVIWMYTLKYIYIFLIFKLGVDIFVVILIDFFNCSNDKIKAYSIIFHVCKCFLYFEFCFDVNSVSIKASFQRLQRKKKIQPVHEGGTCKRTKIRFPSHFNTGNILI